MRVPILEKDEQRLIVNTRDFVGNDEYGAIEIGIGASFVECIIWGAKFTGKVLDIEQAEADKPAGYRGYVRRLLCLSAVKEEGLSRWLRKCFSF